MKEIIDHDELRDNQLTLISYFRDHHDCLPKAKEALEWLYPTPNSDSEPKKENK